MNDYKKKILDQKGQVAVIVVLLLVCLLGITALVIDLGSLYQTRASFQTVADSAALAGAQELPEDPDNAVQVAIGYAARHDVNIGPDDVQILSTLSAFPDTIIVTPSDPDTPTYFAGVFGMETVEVGAYAEAMVGKPAQLSYVVPWLAVIPEGADWQDHLDPGTDKVICGDPEESDFLAWDSTDDPGRWRSRYRDRIIYGYSEPLGVGDTVYARIINPAQTINATQDRIGTWDPFDDLVTYSDGIIRLGLSDDQFVIVAVSYEVEVPKKANDKWSEPIEILAFAPFILTGIEGHGSNARVTGKFIHQAVIITSGDIEAVEEIGFKVVRLVR
jgi:hypothetical protein